jgi:UDPglucose 6-dehydrogenase
LPESARFQNIGIIGVGVVGGALRSYFEGRGIRPRLYDPGLGLGSPAEVDSADLVFACVPTPYHVATGFDATLMEAAVAALSGSKTVVIKSTVLPGTTDSLQERHPQHRLLFNPEFLRETSAAADFLQPDRQIVGFSRRWDRETAEAVMRLLPPAPYQAVMPARSAELIKYATNSFLALKVTFANELFDLSRALGIEYEDVRDGLAADARIGNSHLDVHDGGYRGYGGKCLPKDTMALLDLARELESPLRVLEAAHDVNLALRGESIFEDLVKGGTTRPEALAA